MKNLRSAGGLLAISAVLSCATAINNDIPGSGPSTPEAGFDAGGGAGLGEEGGSPAGGSAPEAGSPGTAGKASGGSGAGGKGGGTAGSTGKGGSGGTVGTAGSAGSSMGGKAGTGSSGAGGSVGGATGTGGGDTVGPCDNPKDLPTAATGDTGPLGTTGAACFRTKSTFNALVCSSFDGRTIKVNGTLAVCGMKTTFAPAIDGWNYFDISAGMYTYAQVGWYTG